MKGKITQKDKNGFALLFSVLISSLLLTIGLSIFSIALKELAISTASRQSIHAFYAADSGREKALYLDTKKGTLMTFDEALGFSSALLGDEDQPIFIVPSIDSNVASSGPNFYVEVNKTWADQSKVRINTTLTSFGHDSTDDDRVERAIEQTY